MDARISQLMQKINDLESKNPRDPVDDIPPEMKESIEDQSSFSLRGNVVNPSLLHSNGDFVNPSHPSDFDR